jgi:hypothetical protein
MRLALAIVFLWLGGVLLFVAFHPMEDSIRTPGDAVNAVREDIGKNDSAWSL